MMKRSNITTVAVCSNGLRCLLLGVITITPFTVAGHASEDKKNEIVIGMSSKPLSVDPHFRDSQPDYTMSWNIYEPLIVDRQATSTQDFLLAEDVSIRSAKHWEIKLKPNLRFHDGSPVTADDVTHSYHRAMNHPNFIGKPMPMSAHLQYIHEVKKINPLSLHIKTSVRNVNLGPGMSRIMIVRKPKDDGLGDTASFNDQRNSLGTGPYRFDGYTKRGDIKLVCSQYYRGKRPDATHVRLMFHTDRQQRLDDFIAAKVDVLEKVTPDEIDWLKTRVEFNTARLQTHRLQFLMLNSSKTPKYVFDKKSGHPLQKNPFQDVRVRHAVAKAINKKRLIHSILNLDGEPADDFVQARFSTFATPRTFGQYDPKEARRLLAVAGYPNGFKMTIHGPNNRYIRDAAILEEIAAMLTEVGIETTATTMPKQAFFARRAQWEFGGFYQGLSATGNALQLLGMLFHSHISEKGLGNRNYSGMSSPEIDRLLDKANTIADPTERRIYQRQITALALEQMSVVPLYFEPSLWVSQKSIEYIPREASFERTLAANIRLLKPQTARCE